MESKPDCADPNFGRLQARDMLQHLWTGPYSNAAVDIIQGSKSVEVRPIGVTKVHRLTHAWNGHERIHYTWLLIYRRKQSLMFKMMFMQGATMGRNLLEIGKRQGPDFKIDYLLCIGHFLSKVGISTRTQPATCPFLHFLFEKTKED